MVYDDIRAYDDADVPDVIDSLLRDNEFLEFISQQTHPKLSRVLPRWTHNKLRDRLSRSLSGVQSVEAWQSTLAPLVKRLLESSTTGVTIRGVEHIPAGPCVFVSNHRDIVMDPLLVNYALMESEKKTCRVAIGDNLISKPFVGQLMRLNKSFVVKRSVTARREKLESVQTLSSYIHDCIKHEHSIWIAQREGRAKDNMDFTDTAVLKMLHMAGRKLGWSFRESMQFLNIVPVTINYEWDPCDIDKAKELYSIRQHGRYEKSSDEDFHSILKGMKGQKGRVSVHFSPRVALASDNPDEWAQKIDHFIHAAYDIFPSQQWAFDQLQHRSSNEQGIAKIWQKRFASVPVDLQTMAMQHYANTVSLKLAAQQSLDETL